MTSASKFLVTCSDALQFKRRQLTSLSLVRDRWCPENAKIGHSVTNLYSPAASSDLNPQGFRNASVSEELQVWAPVF